MENEQDGFLCKREMISAMAMQGILASGSDSVEGNVAR